MVRPLCAPYMSARAHARGCGLSLLVFSQTDTPTLFFSFFISASASAPAPQLQIWAALTAGRRRRRVVPARAGVRRGQGVDAPLVPRAVLGVRRDDAVRAVRSFSLILRLA